MASTPAFAGTPKIGKTLWNSSSTANTKSDGTGTIGTDIMVAFTAGSSGSFVERLRAIIAAVVAATASTPTVLRIYISTATSGAVTSANTKLYQEIALPAQTADQTTTAIYPIDIPLNFRLGANETILISMHHAAAANTLWEFLTMGMDY